jgi:3',5'-cyclic AMP phosphodiesterase CpdA
VSLSSGPRRALAADGETRPLVFMSDTQSPIWVETLILPRNRNEHARRAIFDEVVALRPAAVFHTGDLVNLGWHPPAWEAIDGLTARLRATGVPFYPILGNHELMIFAGAGEEAFQERFPFHRKTGYVRTAGGIAVVLLNSNVWQLAGDERRMQVAFLDSALAVLEADTTVRAVVVCCHHSPFTNSMVVLPSIHSRADFLPAYISSRKARLFISGHAHAFEHFREEGKDFLVIGGGGGLQQPLLTGGMRRWTDLFPGATPKRMFHYLRIAMQGDTLVATVRMMRGDFSGLEDTYAVRAQVPSPPRPPRVRAAQARPTVSAPRTTGRSRTSGRPR